MHNSPRSKHTSMTIVERQKYMANFQSPFCSNASKYQRVAKIGQGTFGVVFKARHIAEPTKFVAMKQVFVDYKNDGFPMTALRELRILHELKHDNVINLIEICKSETFSGMSSFHLVFDFCEHDLAQLLSNANVQFSLGEIKKILQQLLNGLFYIHNNKILHRDLKSANVLIDKHGVLKLADFNLARPFSDDTNKKPNRYTNRVVTLWYRPPELLLGQRNYGSSVDLWGAGCIMAEMWTRSPIMQGSSEQQQLYLISQLCGSINPQSWPGVEKLELYNKVTLPQEQKRQVIERLKPFMRDPYALDLIDKLLVLNPKKRCDADAALNHAFFWTDPMPCNLDLMLIKHSQSMLDLVPPASSKLPDDENKDVVF